MPQVTDSSMYMIANDVIFRTVAVVRSLPFPYCDNTRMFSFIINVLIYINVFNIIPSLPVSRLADPLSQLDQLATALRYTSLPCLYYLWNIPMEIFRLARTLFHFMTSLHFRGQVPGPPPGTSSYMSSIV